MSHVTVPAHGVMEGKGAYNKHATIPASGAVLALPFLERASQEVTLGNEPDPIVIADYGSSQGKNSLRPMRVAIRNLRPRVSPNRPVFVFHIDQPTNDFNCLFEVLSSDPDRYALDEAHVFPCAIGRSFYEQVLPPHSVHLGWCSYAAVWLRQIPSLIPGHFFPGHSTGAAREHFERQAAEDWETFLSLRATEMRTGARFIVVLPALAEGAPGFGRVMDHANAVLAEMVNERAITADERAHMVLGSYPRRKDELLAPFTRDGTFRDLSVEQLDISPLPDAVWAEYRRTGDKQVLAMRHALLFRAIFMPSLARALAGVRAGDETALQTFADRLQNGLIKRLTIDPSPVDMCVQTLVLAKSGA
ncbi:MAG: hypothetical protein JO270_05550 [Acidobacteriaceae bacterium]|nr:hypothetical protein [Acidobacteriaceae bacterium]MBV8570562.1 hypothetical protein [Acidobacteriaceae bacterium]